MAPRQVHRWPEALAASASAVSGLATNSGWYTQRTFIPEYSRWSNARAPPPGVPEEVLPSKCTTSCGLTACSQVGHFTFGLFCWIQSLKQVLQNIWAHGSTSGFLTTRLQILQTNCSYSPRAPPTSCTTSCSGYTLTTSASALEELEGDERAPRPSKASGCGGGPEAAASDGAATALMEAPPPPAPDSAADGVAGPRPPTGDWPTREPKRSCCRSPQTEAVPFAGCGFEGLAGIRGSPGAPAGAGAASAEAPAGTAAPFVRASAAPPGDAFGVAAAAPCKDAPTPAPGEAPAAAADGPPG